MRKIDPDGVWEHFESQLDEQARGSMNVSFGGPRCSMPIW